LWLHQFFVGKPVLDPNQLNIVVVVFFSNEAFLGNDRNSLIGANVVEVSSGYNFH
jgi:hypothetical protein